MDAVQEAKALVAEHEALVRAADLDGIVANVAEDAVLLAPDTPLVEGKAAFREFYAGLLGMGASDFGHDYHGAEVVADTVVLYGVARGTLTPPEGDPEPFANNFLLMVKKQADGKYRFWRGGFAASGEIETE